MTRTLGLGLGVGLRRIGEDYPLAWQISQQGVQAWVGSQHRGDIQVVNRVQIDLRVNTVTIHQAMQCHRVVAAQTA